MPIAVPKLRGLIHNVKHTEALNSWIGEAEITWCGTADIVGGSVRIGPATMNVGETNAGMDRREMVGRVGIEPTTNGLKEAPPKFYNVINQSLAVFVFCQNTSKRQ